MNLMLDPIATLLDESLEINEQVRVLKQLTIDKINREQLSRLVIALREQAVKINLVAENTVDLVGTGGDGANTFNISTAASFIVAASGVPIAKHGNRASTSRVGSYDCLLNLGIPIPQTPEKVLQQLQQYQYSFLFAPFFHASLKRFSEARKVCASEGQKTIFNLLGPLLNPAQVRRLAIGVFSKNLLPLFAETLLKLNVKKALVFHGNGLDELNLNGTNYCLLIENNQIKEMNFSAQDLGLHSCHASELIGGDAIENARMIEAILQCQASKACIETVLLNAAAAIFVAHDDIDLKQALTIARTTLQSGAAYAKLQAVRQGQKDFLAELLPVKQTEITQLSEPQDIKININDFKAVLKQSNSLAIIAEIKPQSPTAGAMAVNKDLIQLAQDYECAGVSAISVLTDTHYFGGSFQLLNDIYQKVNVPLLCKDFIISRKQILLAKQSGASACLLIVNLLNDAQLLELNDFVLQQNMTAVIEVHDEMDLKRALKLNPEIILINQRNLRSLAFDRTALARLCPLIPENVIVIAASGIASKDDIIQIPKRCDAVLIGSALMRSENAGELIKKLRGE